MKTINLALVDLGMSVRLLRLLTAKKQELQENFGFNPRITAIATGSHGFVFDPNGIDEQTYLTS